MSAYAREAANLYNSAFASVLIIRAVHEFEKASGSGMPFTFAWVVTTIALTPHYRDTLPSSVRTRFLKWRRDNETILASLPMRTSELAELSQSAVSLALRSNFLRLEGARLHVGDNASSITKLRKELTEDAKDCLEKAAFLGKWLSIGKSESSTLIIMGAFL